MNQNSLNIDRSYLTEVNSVVDEKMISNLKTMLSHGVSLMDAKKSLQIYKLKFLGHINNETLNAIKDVAEHHRILRHLSPVQTNAE